MKRLLQLTLVLLITAGLTTVANAQVTIQAQATVDANSSVTAGNNLNFNNIASGASQSVAPDEAGAGTFTVSGNQTVDLSFTLPSNLTNGSGDNMGITFGNNDAAWSDDASASNTFDPSTGTTNPINLVSETSDGEITVFIGGTINSSNERLVAGSYSGDITLTATFN